MYHYAKAGNFVAIFTSKEDRDLKVANTGMDYLSASQAYKLIGGVNEFENRRDFYLNARGLETEGYVYLPITQ